MSGKFLAGPVSVVDFFGSKMGGRFTNAACECPIWRPLHSNLEMAFFKKEACQQDAFVLGVCAWCQEQYSCMHILNV